MNIERLTDNHDDLTLKDSLLKNTAFIVNEKYVYEFDIVDADKAIIYCKDPLYINEAINEFRFYTFHISKFYNDKNELIASFDHVKIFKIAIEKLQPSQFYISMDKYNNVKKWIKQIYIPVTLIDDEYVICDGHTRLKVAHDKNIKEINAYIDDSAGEYLKDFVLFAKEKGIYAIKDMKVISKKDYKLLWHDFCYNHFNSKK